MLKEASKEIYNQLINGKIINRHIYSTSAGLEENPLYDEISLDLEAYKEHYSMNGLELARCGDGYFLRDENAEWSKNVPALKVQALLLIISRHCTAAGTRVEAILDVVAGIRQPCLEEISELDEVKDILNACQMKSNLLNEIENNLIYRGIAYWNQSAGLVLTDGGKGVFQQMFAPDS